MRDLTRPDDGFHNADRRFGRDELGEPKTRCRTRNYAPSWSGPSKDQNLKAIYHVSGIAGKDTAKATAINCTKRQKGLQSIALCSGFSALNSAQPIRRLKARLPLNIVFDISGYRVLSTHKQSQPWRVGAGAHAVPLLVRLAQLQPPRWGKALWLTLYRKHDLLLFWACPSARSRAGGDRRRVLRTTTLGVAWSTIRRK